MKLRIRSAMLYVLLPTMVVGGHLYHFDLDTRATEGVAGVNFNLTSLQTFRGALGGIVAPPITNSGQATKPYQVNGSTFNDFPTAFGRSCDNQHNECASAANANGNKGSFKTADCDEQTSECMEAGASATLTNFQVLRRETTDFFVFCDS